VITVNGARSFIAPATFK